MNEVIVVGTKKKPEPVPTGTYIYPLKQIEINSYFGEQRAEFDGEAYHYGIDLAAKQSTTIFASDGGKIIYADYSSSYGLMIQIEHADGVTTLYAHCSKLLVSKGDAVYQGQEIALVGDTGVATGPHLHFEMRRYGQRIDPLKYIK